MLEATLVVIAKAIISQAAGQAARPLTKRLDRRLRGTPVERAVAGALGDALQELRRSRPGAASVLFDRTFLESRSAASVLARLLVPGEPPDAEALAAAWSTHISSAGGDRYAGDEIVAAAGTLLTAFERALDTPERQEALGELRSYRAARTTADAASQYAAWASAQKLRVWINPDQRYRELDLDRFAGRAWLLDHVDEFLACRDSGYFVLEGAAGLGKSAFLAWLARERGYPVHFVRLAEAREDTTAALSNLAVQLADAWQVDGPVSLQGPDVRPHEFYELLEGIARTREQRRRSDPVVIVIDGLDEVRASPDARGNVLGLPRRPPEGVYFVVSQRPVRVALSVDSAWPCRLLTDDRQHLDDLRAYLTVACSRPAIKQAREHAGVPAAQMVAALTDKSAGVWLYVHYIITEVERGQRDLSRLDDLPTGLWEFYAEQCEHARARYPERWERYDLSVLSTLAAAQEPLSRPVLAALVGVDDGAALREVLRTWAAFLERSGRPPYRLYHDSLRRFFSGEVAQALAASELVAEEFAIATAAAHRRIADHYLAAWGGLEHGLPGLRDLTGAAHHGGYGLRQLGAHLRAASRYEQLRELLLAEWADGPRPLSAWYEAHAQAGDHVRYLRDVEHARALAEEATEAALLAGRAAATLGDEYGYALIGASLQSHSANLPPQLRAALIKRRIWSAARAIADALHLSDPEGRAAALSALPEHLRGAERKQTLGDALDAARQIRDGRARADALITLVQQLDGSERQQALSEALGAARQTRYMEDRVEVLAALAPHLDGGQLGEAWHTAFQILPYHEERARVLSTLAQHMEGAERQQALSEALDDTRHLQYECQRVDALAAIAKHLDGSQRQEALAEALNTARQIERGGRPRPRPGRARCRPRGS